MNCLPGRIDPIEGLGDAESISFSFGGASLVADFRLDGFDASTGHPGPNATSSFSTPKWSLSPTLAKAISCSGTDVFNNW